MNHQIKSPLYKFNVNVDCVCDIDIDMTIHDDNRQKQNKTIHHFDSQPIQPKQKILQQVTYKTKE